MAFAGSRSRVTVVWLLLEDERAVGDAIVEALPGAQWRCSQPGPVGLHEVHLHSDVVEAMACGGTQAFLALPAGASLPPTVLTAPVVGRPTGPSSVAAIQLLRSRLRDDTSRPYFESGRLAVRWFENEVPPAVHQVLLEQTALAWKALRQATRPAKIQDASGRITTGMRIGVSAKAFVSEREIPLRRSGLTEYSLA